MDVKQVSSVLIVFLVVSLAPAAAYNFSMFLSGSSVNTDDSGDKMFDQSQQSPDPEEGSAVCNSQEGSVVQDVRDTQEYVVQYPVVQYVSDEQTSEQTTNQRRESESTVEDNSTQNGTENSTGNVDQPVIENNSVVTPVNSKTNESFKNTANGSSNVTTSNLTNATTGNFTNATTGNITNATGNFTSATMGNLGDTDPTGSTDDTSNEIGIWTSFGTIMVGTLVTLAGGLILIHVITDLTVATTVGGVIAAAALPVVGVVAVIAGFAAIIGGNIALAIFAL